MVWLIWGDAGVITVYHCCVMMERSAPWTLAFQLSLVAIFSHFWQEFVHFLLFFPGFWMPALKRQKCDRREDQAEAPLLPHTGHQSAPATSLQTVGTLLSLSRYPALSLSGDTGKYGYGERELWRDWKVEYILLFYAGEFNFPDIRAVTQVLQPWLGASLISHPADTESWARVETLPTAAPGHVAATRCHTWPASPGAPHLRVIVNTIYTSCSDPVSFATSSMFHVLS